MEGTQGLSEGACLVRYYQKGRNDNALVVDRKFYLITSGERTYIVSFPKGLPDEFVEGTRKGLAAMISSLESIGMMPEQMDLSLDFPNGSARKL